MATSLEASVVYEEVTDVVMECLSEVRMEWLVFHDFCIYIRN